MEENELYKTDLLIPLNVLRDKKLNANEKIYLATYLMNNKDIKETEKMLFDFSKYQINKAKKRLIELGYIKGY